MSKRSLPASRCRATLVFVDALPRNALGKVQHFLLREEAQRR